MRTIGVKELDPLYFIDVKSSITHDLLYFDEVVYNIPQIELIQKLLKGIKGQDIFQRKMHELEVLRDSGLLSEYTQKEKKIDLNLYRNEITSQYNLKVVKLFTEFLDRGGDKKIGFSKRFDDFLLRARGASHLEARTNSVLHNKKDSVNYYVPVIKNDIIGVPNELEGLTCTQEKQEVISIILKKFPIIDDYKDIQNLIEFKKDPETILKLSRLRNWVNEISRDNLSSKEIEQKLDYLLIEYKAQIELHKLHYSHSTLETFTVTTLKILENVIKLNFSEAAEAIFDIKRTKLKLMEEENRITGKEVAILYDLNAKKNANNIIKKQC